MLVDPSVSGSRDALPAPSCVIHRQSSLCEFTSRPNAQASHCGGCLRESPSFRPHTMQGSITLAHCSRVEVGNPFASKAAWGPIFFKMFTMSSHQRRPTHQVYPSVSGRTVRSQYTTLAFAVRQQWAHSTWSESSVVCFRLSQHEGMRNGAPVQCFDLGSADLPELASLLSYTSAGSYPSRQGEGLHLAASLADMMSILLPSILPCRTSSQVWWPAATRKDYLVTTLMMYCNTPADKEIDVGSWELKSVIVSKLLETSNIELCSRRFSVSPHVWSMMPKSCAYFLTALISTVVVDHCTYCVQHWSQYPSKNQTTQATSLQ